MMEVKVYDWLMYRTMKSVTMHKAGDSRDSDEIVFEDMNGETLTFFHGQDCCERVEINDIVGDLEDLVGSPITLAEEVVNSDEDGEHHSFEYESFTWTFYKFATVKGYVTVRWLGTSNGYYSESVHTRFGKT